jgi:hypothetical protein
MTLRVARGANRTVVLVGRYALKFPTFNSWRDFLFGLLNNQTEARVGRSGRDDVCPVLWADPWGFLVVMPRLPIMTAAGFAALAVTHSVWNLSVERKPCSFGLYDGRVVAVDYGWGN